MLGIFEKQVKWSVIERAREVSLSKGGGNNPKNMGSNDVVKADYGPRER